MSTLLLSDKITRTVIDDEDYKRVIDFSLSWSMMKGGVGTSRYLISNIRKTMLLHRLIMNCHEKGFYVDHINKDILDNRKENLRVCTNAENCQNRKIRSTNTSGYKGVSFVKHINKWQARIYVNKVEINLGYFVNKNDAAIAYNNAAIQHHKQFAVLNVIV
jgi:hypothetical protein